MTTSLVLDSEAVSVLFSTGTDARRKALIAQIEAARGTRRTRSRPVGRVVVPTTVRVEAGWDRTAPNTSALNRLTIADHALDAGAANVAATIRRTTEVSPADAHVGALIRALAHDETVVVATSDEADMHLVAGDRQIKTLKL